MMRARRYIASRALVGLALVGAIVCLATPVLAQVPTPEAGHTSDVATDQTDRIREAWELLRSPAPGSGREVTRAYQLAEAADASVASVGLLAVGVAEGDWVTEYLVEALGGPDPTRREYAALGLLFRAALVSASTDVDAAVASRARAEITTPAGRAWQRGLALLAEWDEARQTWLEAVARAAELTRGDESRARCLALLDANPTLSLSVSPSDADAAAARLTLAPAPRRPSPAMWSPGTTARDLFVTGDHAALADWRYQIEDAAAAWDTYVEGAERVCSEWRPPESVSTTANRPRVARQSWWDARLSLSLGVDSQPFALRSGSSADFIVGESLELSVAPAFSFRWERTPREPGLTRDEGRIGANAVALDAAVGGFVSSRFFEERSRPAASVAMQYDAAAPDPNGIHRGFRLEASAALAAGVGPDYMDLALQPAPYVRGSVLVGQIVHDDPAAAARPARELGLRLDGLVHVWDDDTALPRDRAWLEPELFYVLRTGSRDEPVRLGLRGAASARLTEGRRQLGQRERVASFGAPTAGVAHLDMLVSWNRPSLWVEGHAGVAGGALFGEMRRGERALVGPVGGLSLHARTAPAGVGIGMTLRLVHELRTLGRQGEVGLVDRAEGRLGLTLTGEMTDEIQIGLFLERVRPIENDERLGWGGVELVVPIGIAEVDQAIVYRARYAAVVDSVRFGSVAQQVFETVLTAGVRF